MISGIEWIPQGVADPNPKKYELSHAEAKLIQEQARIQRQRDLGEDEDEPNDEDSDNEDRDTTNLHDKDAMEDATTTETTMSATELIASQPVDTSTLPADLRMDEYSEDDDEDGTNRTSKMMGLGNLLIGNNDGGIGIDEDGNMDTLPDDDDKIEMDSDEESNDLDSEDEELDDIPDTREYTPTNIPGLQSMAFSGHTTPHRNEHNHTLNSDDDDNDDQSTNSNQHDTNLQPNDALLLSLKTDAESEFSSLEVHVYERDTGNLFVHHDIPLPAYPLTMAHGTIGVGGVAGNFVAVGTFEPGIEVWNLDVLDVLEPMCVLGGEDFRGEDEEWARQFDLEVGGCGKKKKTKGKKGNSTTAPRRTEGQLLPHSHNDAVMSLSWSKTHRQILASGSADKTVKLWDITRADDASSDYGHAATFTHHTDKVEAVEWHPTEGSILATGSYDRSVAILDARMQNGGMTGGKNGCVKRAKLSADCEAIAWDLHQGHLLTAASEDGSLCCWDVRKFEGGGCYWKFVAHEYGGCSDIAYNPNVPGMLATCAIDKTVVLWDTLHATSKPDERPIHVGSKSMNVGQLFSVSFYPSETSSCLLACGGGGGELALWDLERETFFGERFGQRVKSMIVDAGAGAGAGASGSEVADEGGCGDDLEDFEATMAMETVGILPSSFTQKDEVGANNSNSTKGKKKKKKKKPKAHRKGR